MTKKYFRSDLKYFRSDQKYFQSDLKYFRSDLKYFRSDQKYFRSDLKSSRSDFKFIGVTKNIFGVTKIFSEWPKYFRSDQKIFRSDSKYFLVTLNSLAAFSNSTHISNRWPTIESEIAMKKNRVRVGKSRKEKKENFHFRFDASHLVRRWKATEREKNWFFFRKCLEKKKIFTKQKFFWRDLMNFFFC